MTEKTPEPPEQAPAPPQQVSAQPPRTPFRTFRMRFRSLLDNLKQHSFFRGLVKHFEKLIVIIITLVAVLAALIALLQSWADGNATRYARQSQELSVEAINHDMSSRQRETHDFELYVTWNEWDWRRTRAARLNQDREGAQAAAVADMISPVTPLLDPELSYYEPEGAYADVALYHANTNLITTTILMEQRVFVNEIGNRWNSKGDGYVTVLTVLAVAMFLYGLSTTIAGVVRYLFALAGTFLVGICVLWTLVLTVMPVPDVPYAAIEAYARGQGLIYAVDYEAAAEALDTSLDLYPHYGNALAARASLALDLNDYPAAIQLYRRALENGRDGPDIYWELGWALYLAGDYEAAVEADRAALERAPDMLPVMMNVATTLLASGQTEEAMQAYAQGLVVAGDPASSIPVSWNHLYLLETVNDLDRLIAALDGQSGFDQEPDLHNVADPAQVRASAEQARLRIQEGIVRIENDEMPVAATQALLEPLTFAQNAGHDGVLLGEADTFPRGADVLSIQVAFENLPTGAMLSRRVTRQQFDEPGWLEDLPTMRDDRIWEGDASGQIVQQIVSPWPGRRGFQPGLYTVDYYVNGSWARSGQFTIPDIDTFIVGPPVFVADFSTTENQRGTDNIFPAGVAELHGKFLYSGVPQNTVFVGKWYRDAVLYDQLESNPRSAWGVYAFFLRKPPAGTYRYEVYLQGEATPLYVTDVTVLSAEAYQDAIDQPSDLMVFHRNLGDAYLFADEYHLATEHFEHAVDLDAECDVCIAQWARALRELGDTSAAEEKFLLALEKRPLEYTYRCELADLYYQLGTEEKALELYRQAVPSNPETVFNLWGNSLYDLKRYDEAAWKYRQAIDFAPTMATYHFNLGLACLNSQDYGCSEPAFARAVELDSDNDWYYNRWGDALYAQGKFTAALEQYTRAAELDPEYAPYFSDLGDTYYDLERYEEAIDAARRALELTPRARDYNLWGNALYQLERYEEAAEKYEQAVALQPDEALYSINLGWAYFHVPDTEAAIAVFERTVELAGQTGDTELQEEAETALEALR